MDSVIPPNEIEAEASRRDLRAHYEAVAQDTLRLLWLKRRLIGRCIAAALVLALIALVHMGPRYTGEALIKLDFDGGEAVASAGKGRATPITVGAIEEVKSVADIIHSRAIADAVVDRLGLDKDPRFDRVSLSSRVLSLLRKLLGLQPTGLTPRGVAADAVMKRVQVLTGERSYVITIVANAGDPKTAAELANAVAAEYWRTRSVEETLAARSDARLKLAQVAFVYGPRVPIYREAKARLDLLQQRLKTLRAAPMRELLNAAVGHSLIPAQIVNQPSGPNVPVILFVAIIAGFAAGAAFARYGIEPRLPPEWSAFLARFYRPALDRFWAPLFGRVTGTLRASRHMPRGFDTTWPLSTYLRRREPDWKEPELERPRVPEEARLDG